MKPFGSARLEIMGAITNLFFTVKSPIFTGSKGSIFAVVGGAMVISRSDVSTFVGNAGSYRTLFGISFFLVLISFISLFLVAERKSEKKKRAQLLK